MMECPIWEPHQLQNGKFRTLSADSALLEKDRISGMSGLGRKTEWRLSSATFGKAVVAVAVRNGVTIGRGGPEHRKALS